jgi:hypothetical protein
MVLPQDDPALRLLTEASAPEAITEVLASDPTVVSSAATMAQSTVGLVFTGDKRLARTTTGTSYAHAWSDKNGRTPFGIRTDGTVEAAAGVETPRAGKNLGTVNGLSYAVTSPGGLVSELALGYDGCVPSWVLNRWVGRMGLSASTLRKTAEALTVSDGTSTDTRTAAQVRLPVKLGVDATITAVHFRNYRDRSGLAFTGALSFVGTYWGKHAQGASGALTGNFTTAPTQLAGAATTPADGAEYKISGLNIPIKAGTEYLLSYAYTCAAQTNYAGVGGCWTNGTTADVSATTATQTVAQYAPLDVWLEITTTAPIIAYMGDSLSAGVGNELPMYQSPPKLHARANGYVAQMYVHSGSAMTTWTGSGTVKYTKWAGLDRPDALVFSLGKNDINGTITTADLRTRFADVYATISAAISSNIYLTTVLPNVNDTDAVGITRKAWNEILLNEKLGNAVVVFDTAKALAVAGGTGLDPVYDTGDGTHLTKRGSNAVATAITHPLHG